MAAAAGSHLETMDLLIRDGANVNRGVIGDGNALIVAAKHGQLEAVRLLLDRGAEIERGVIGDGNALIMASGCGHVDVVKLPARPRRLDREGGAGRRERADSRVRERSGGSRCDCSSRAARTSTPASGDPRRQRPPRRMAHPALDGAAQRPRRGRAHPAGRGRARVGPGPSSRHTPRAPSGQRLTRGPTPSIGAPRPPVLSFKFAGTHRVPRGSGTEEP